MVRLQQLRDKSQASLRLLSDEHLNEYIAGWKPGTADWIAGNAELQRRQNGLARWSRQHPFPGGLHRRPAGEGRMMAKALKLAVRLAARLAYFWAFIALFHLAVAFLSGGTWLAERIPHAFTMWQYWFTAIIAVAVGRFSLLDEFLDERL